MFMSHLTQEHSGGVANFYGSHLETAFLDTCRCFHCQALIGASLVPVVNFSSRSQAV